MARGEFYRAIVSGEARGTAALVARAILYPFSLPYAGVVQARNILFALKLLKTQKPPVPVISVGNITTGGTGKTPLVAYLAREALRRGLRPAVLARGYRGEKRNGEWINDEGLLLREEVPGLIVVQDPDRLAAAGKAIGGHGADFLLLDDAFQHRRIDRDVDIVTLDAARPFGNGRVLPAGLLREPVRGIKRADALVLTRCEGVADEDLRRAEDLVRRLSAGAQVYLADHAADSLRTVAGEERPLASLEGMRLYLCAGIADPGHFERTALSLGCRWAGLRAFPDHHRYTQDDVNRVIRDARRAGAEGVLTTAKDAVKLEAFPEARDMLVLHISIRIREHEDELLRLVFGSMP